MTHRHLVYGQPSKALAIGWCECGEELQLDSTRIKLQWREPKTLEGKQRRARWAAKEKE